jgi:hypothetical protein
LSINSEALEATSWSVWWGIDVRRDAMSGFRGEGRDERFDLLEDLAGIADDQGMCA